MDSIGRSFSHRAKSLLQAHNASIGTAATNDCGRSIQINKPSPTARTGIQLRYRSTGVPRSPSSASAAVSHSSRCSRVNTRRNIVRTTASSDNRVWCASRVRVSSTLKFDAKRLLTASRAIRRSRATSARTRPKPRSNHAGTNKMQIVAMVQRMGWRITSQPNKSNAKVAGSTRLRRRLSKIFQRETSEIGFRTFTPASSGTRSVSHSTICQSPRSQRCLRRL